MNEGRKTNTEIDLAEMILCAICWILYDQGLVGVAFPILSSIVVGLRTIVSIVGFVIMMITVFKKRLIGGKRYEDKR